MRAFVVLSLVFPYQATDWRDERLRNDLFCVEWDVNLNSINSRIILVEAGDSGPWIPWSAIRPRGKRHYTVIHKNTRNLSVMTQLKVNFFQKFFRWHISEKMLFVVIKNISTSL